MECYTAHSNEDAFKAGTIFVSFHHQAGAPISDTALLASFIILWLKKSVAPTFPHEVIIADVVYSAILLAYGHSLGLLPAMVKSFMASVPLILAPSYPILISRLGMSSTVQLL